MEHPFNPNNTMPPYTVRRSRRARYMRLTIRPDGTLIATRPWGASLDALERFIREKADWIARTIARMKSLPRQEIRHDTAHYRAHRPQALAFVRERLVYYNEHYGFPFQAVTVRNQRSRWGSCSRKGNLSFNYHLLFLPIELADYVIVHELCHLGEFNHSRKFWELVARTVPDYRQKRKLLRQRGMACQ